MGTERGVAPFIGEHTRVVELRGRTVLENHTAALLEPYPGKSDERGMPFVDPEMLKKIVTRLDIDAVQVHFHAIGDAAIRQSLDAVEAARTSNGNLGNRHHVSHIELFDPADIPRFQQLEVVANSQPPWACEAGVNFLGSAQRPGLA